MPVMDRRMKFRLTPRRYVAMLISVCLLVSIFVMVGAENILHQLRQLSPWSVLLAFACVLTIPFWVALRFWRVLAHFGVAVSWAASLRASVAGQVASLIVIPLFGQVAGRQVLLSRSGLSPESNAAFAAYERVATALISGFSAMLGALHLAGGSVVGSLITAIDLVPAMLAILAGMLVSCWVGMGGFERSILARITERRNLQNIFEIFAVSFAGYAAMILAFLVLFSATVPSAPVVSMLAAAAMVSFAASMPISVGGWGLREVAAVYVLGKFGIPAAEALAISIIVGLLSTVAVLLVAAGISGMHTKVDAEPHSEVDTLTPKTVDIDRVSSWGLGLAVGILVFFQIHVPIGGTTTNVNLADPFAVLALAAVTLGSVISRRLPQWNVRGFNSVLFVFSALWVLGFWWGWRSFGFSQWAFVGRLMGWLVLLGYLAAGYLIVSRHGRHGIRRIIETLAAVSAAVVLVHAATRMILPVLDSTVVLGNFEGFAHNRNAFAFQMLSVIALVTGCSYLYGKAAKGTGRRVWLGSLLGVALAGLLWSASRTGIATAVVILVFACFVRIADRFMLMVAVGIAGGLWFAPWGIEWLRTLIDFDHIGVTGSTLQSHMSNDASDAGRWAANTMALKALMESPIFGIGLGGFLEISPERFGFPMVIHSTPIWILAELGLVGAGGLGFAVFVFARHLFFYWQRGSQNRSLLLLLIAFSIFCLMHEILFQRIFWFALGILIAKPSLAGSAHRKEA